MKGLFKFIPVALGLLTLASCNSEDFYGGDAASKKATLEVTVEDMGDGQAITRTAYTAKNSRSWQETDIFTVYDDELHKYDYYKYNATNNAFEIEGKKDLTEPKFVAFPKEQVVTTAWEKETNSVFLGMGIPGVWNFGELALEDGTAAFLSQLPMWGTAEVDGESIKTKVSFLTSYIKVTIDNALNNVDAVRIRAYEDIAATIPACIWGLANAQLSEEGEPLTETKLTMATKYPAGAADAVVNNVNDGNAIVVNLVDPGTGDKLVESGTSCIFIPLIAGHYGKVVVEYLDNGGNWATPGNVHAIKTWYDKEFERGGLPYGASLKTFKAAAKNIAQLNEVIATYANQTGEINIEAAAGQNTEVDEANAAVGGDLIIPADMKATTINIKVNQFVGTAAGKTLTIKGGYTGNVMIKIPAATGLSQIGTVKVDMPSAATVGFAGNWTVGTPAFTIVNAKKLVFGDGTTNTTFGDLGSLNDKIVLNGVTVAEKATIGNIAPIAESGNIEVQKGGTAGTITYAENHRANALIVDGTAGAITVNASVLDMAKNTAITVGGTAGDITVNGAANDATVEVSGVAGAIVVAGTGKVTITGMATSVANKAGGVEISGAPYFDIAADKYAKVNGNVTTEGQVDIDLNDEGAAISGTLTMSKVAALNLTQGYVNALTLNLPAAANEVTLTLGDKKYVALGTVTLTQGKLKLANSKNVWNGKKVGATLTNDTKDATGAAIAAAGVTEVKGAWVAYGNAAAVYTATTFADLAGAAMTLANNIDLDNAAWTPVALAGDFDGAGHTISNLTIPAKKDKDVTAANAGIGLFTTVAANTVQNLTIDGVDITANPYKVGNDDNKTVVSNIGALAGLSTGATINLVTVKNITINATGGSHTIGAVIGSTSAAKTTFAGVQVTGTNAIKGYYNAGGFVGYAGKDIDVTKLAKNGIVAGTPAADVKSFANFAFTANFDAATEATPKLGNDTKYLQVGSLVGSFDGTAKLVFTDIDNIKNASFTSNLDKYTGTYANVVTVDDELQYYAYVWPTQNLIGFAGKVALGDDYRPSVNGKLYQIYVNKATGTDADLAGTAAKPFALYYINK